MNLNRKILEQQKNDFRSEDRKAKRIRDLEVEHFQLWARFDDRAALLREALESMLNLSPRVKEYDGCFGKMAGGMGGEDCECTACKIRREIGDK